jgi:hypothetical protein
MEYLIRLKHVHYRQIRDGPEAEHALVRLLTRVLGRSIRHAAGQREKEFLASTLQKK